MIDQSGGHERVADCAACHRSIAPELADHVRFGEFWFHAACVPACRACGCRPGSDDEATWRYHARVVSTAFGYAQRPSGFLCPACLDGALRDEAPYLD